MSQLGGAQIPQYSGGQRQFANTNPPRQQYYSPWQRERRAYRGRGRGRGGYYRGRPQYYNNNRSRTWRGGYNGGGRGGRGRGGFRGYSRQPSAAYGQHQNQQKRSGGQARSQGSGNPNTSKKGREIREAHQQEKLKAHQAPTITSAHQYKLVQEVCGDIKRLALQDPQLKNIISMDLTHNAEGLVSGNVLIKNSDTEVAASNDPEKIAENKALRLNTETTLKEPHQQLMQDHGANKPPGQYNVADGAGNIYKLESAVAGDLYSLSDYEHVLKYHEEIRLRNAKRVSEMTKNKYDDFRHMPQDVYDNTHRANIDPLQAEVLAHKRASKHSC